MGGALRRRSRSWPHGHPRCRGGVAGDMRRECGEGRQKRNLRSPPTSSVPRRIPPWRCATPRIEALGHGPRQGGRWYAAVGHREDSVGWGRGKGLRSARAMCQALFTLGRFLPSSLSALLFLDHLSPRIYCTVPISFILMLPKGLRSARALPHLTVFCPPLSPPALLVPRSSFSSRPDLCFSAGSGLPWRCGSIPPGLSSLAAPPPLICSPRPSLLGLSKSPESLCQSEVRNRAHDHKMVAKRSRIEGMYHNCGIMTIRFRSTIIHNRVRVVVQGGLPPSHLNLCGSLRSGTAHTRTICNTTRLT